MRFAQRSGLFAFVAAVASVALVGCSSDDSSSEPTPGDDSGAEAAADSGLDSSPGTDGSATDAPADSSTQPDGQSPDGQSSSDASDSSAQPDGQSVQEAGPEGSAGEDGAAEAQPDGQSEVSTDAGTPSFTADCNTGCGRLAAFVLACGEQFVGNESLAAAQAYCEQTHQLADLPDFKACLEANCPAAPIDCATLASCAGTMTEPASSCNQCSGQCAYEQQDRTLYCAQVAGNELVHCAQIQSGCSGDPACEAQAQQCMNQWHTWQQTCEADSQTTYNSCRQTCGCPDIEVTFILDATGSSIPVGQYTAGIDPNGTAFIVGNQSAIGNWTPNSVAMADDGSSFGDATASDKIWAFRISVPLLTQIQYKYTLGAQGQSWSGTEEYPVSNRGLRVQDSDGDGKVQIRDVFADRPTPDGTMAPNSQLENP